MELVDVRWIGIISTFKSLHREVEKATAESIKSLDYTNDHNIKIRDIKDKYYNSLWRQYSIVPGLVIIYVQKKQP